MAKNKSPKTEVVKMIAFSIRLRPEVAVRLHRLADNEERSVAYMVGKAVDMLLAERARG